MDIFDSALQQIGSIGTLFLSLSFLGALEIISVFVIIFYVCTRTRASSIIWELVPFRLNGYQGSYYLLQKGANILSSIRNKTEEVTSDRAVNDHRAQDLLRVTQHAGRKPYSSLLDWGVYFPFLAQCVRLKRFAFPQVSGEVMKDAKLQRAVKQAAEEFLRENNPIIPPDDEALTLEESDRYQRAIKKQEMRALKILTDMKSKISDLLLRITSWILYKLLPCFLSGVVTHTRQIEMLRTATEKAPGIPLIFLPLHRSHLDYIMVSFILLNNDIRSPLVAAGNNLQIPVFGSLLRGLGAFFIKRKIDPVIGKKDTLYRAILHLYLTHALEAGHNVEFFIEGGRTRTGKPCMPKNGILSVIVNAFMDGTIEDALLVPVSVNYERLVDGNFVREQLGQKKEPETFCSAISGIWKALNSNYGLMRIDFNEPFSIRELVKSFNKIAKEEGSNKIYKPASRQLQHNQSSSSLYGTDVVCEEHRTLVDSISRQVVYDCAVATSVMTTNAVSFLLLTRFREGVSEQVLVEHLDLLRADLKGRRDLGFTGDSLQIVHYACELLGSDLISRAEAHSEMFIRPILNISNVIELSYYSNALTPHFALESIVITSLYYLLLKEAKGGVSKRKLKETCLEHCEIMRYEFILSKPTQNLDTLLDDSIDNLCAKDILISVEAQVVDETVAQSQKLSHYIEGLIDDDYLENFDGEIEKPEISLATDRYFDQKALMNVLAPFSYSYYYVSLCLDHLLGNSVIESEFIKLVIKKITTEVEQGACPFGESISTESVKNCLKLLEKWSVIEVCSLNGLRLLSLGGLCDSSYGIKNIIDRFQAIVPEYTH